MDLLERAEFLDDFQRTLTDVTRSSGCVVLVSGEAGIGKTSLVEQFAAAQKPPARVLWGGCDALFTPRPLGPLYDIAQQIPGDLLALLENEASRASIFSAVFDELRNHPATLLIIEDIHWADEATLDLLKFLGRRINRLNSLLIVTYRDDEVRSDHPLRLVLGDLPRRCVTRLRLPPLSEAAVDQLAERAGKRIEDLYAVTGGNPFFVTEALASNDSGVPVSVSDTVLSRVARLSPAARMVVELVSVIPAKAETWLVNDTLNPSTAALEECISTGMLLSEGEAISFRHELARRAVEDSLAAPRLQNLHSLVLKALVKRGSEGQLARIVHHAAKAGDVSAVLEYAPVAARQAAALNAHRESALHYETALKYSEFIRPIQRASLFENHSYQCYLTGQIDDACEARRRALEIWRQLDDVTRQGDNLRWMSRLTWFLGRKEEAEEYAREAIAILETLPESPELAMAYSNRSQLHMLAEQTSEAVFWGSRAIELAEKFGATETLVHALTNVGSAELMAHNEQGRAKLEESLRLSLAHNLEEHAARALTNLSSAAVRDRTYSMALRYLDEGIAYTTEHDLDSWGLYMQAWRARVYFDQGRWTSATDDAASVLGNLRVSAITRIPALCVLGHIRLRRGDPDASRVLTEAHELAMQTKEIQRIAPVASARIEQAWLAGDLEHLVEEARSVLRLAKNDDDPWIQGEFAFWLWRAGAAQTVEQGIAEPYALQMSGQWRAAAEAWRKIGCPYEEAVALTDGDEPAQLDALEIFENLGAGPAAEKLRHALRKTGARGIPRGPRPSTKANPGGLTNREMEVLSLICDGRTNAEIADRLFISAKTVDHHVSAILAKLDAHTRAEAVSLALQSNLIKPK
ncbi:MAG TPA: AAA family ATPase [Pyrinomonadaceae bacterium]|nr:AAA family ATPase [Pyrinomonadaceae bacterium]